MLILSIDPSATHGAVALLRDAPSFPQPIQTWPIVTCNTHECSGDVMRGTSRGEARWERVNAILDSVQTLDELFQIVSEKAPETARSDSDHKGQARIGREVHRLAVAFQCAAAMRGIPYHEIEVGHVDGWRSAFRGQLPTSKVIRAQRLMIKQMKLKQPDPQAEAEKRLARMLWPNLGQLTEHEYAALLIGAGFLLMGKASRSNR